MQILGTSARKLINFKWKRGKYSVVSVFGSWQRFFIVAHCNQFSWSKSHLRQIMQDPELCVSNFFNIKLFFRFLELSSRLLFEGFAVALLFVMIVVYLGLRRFWTFCHFILFHVGKWHEVGENLNLKKKKLTEAINFCKQSTFKL